jgi:hypothetical protein
METWQIIFAIIGVIWALGFLLGATFFVFGWKENRKLEWKFLLGGISFPLVLLFGLCLIIDYYYSFFIKDEGLVNHIRRIRQVRRDEKEYKRIEEAYKKGEIKRDELPKLWCDGVVTFELKGEFMYGDWHELVYIENEYNPLLNDFFKRHTHIGLEHGCRVVYLPTEIKRIVSDEIVDYLNPQGQGEVELLSLKPTDLLNELYYPDDAKNLHHGLMSCFGHINKYGAEYMHGTYYQLEEGSDEDIQSQIEHIVQIIYEDQTSGLNCTVYPPSFDEEPTEDYADERYPWEITNLVDEIKERVDKLEQHGISRKLLMKMISGQPKLSQLVITKDMRIMLPDYNDMEIKMEPINKAVYLLFLNHPEGIIFKHLPDYRKELVEIYQKIKPWGLNERVIRSIEDVTNPMLNSINEKCARIRGAFIAQFDDSLARHYYIYGQRGEAKKISLPRDLVVWE